MKKIAFITAVAAVTLIGASVGIKSAATAETGGLTTPDQEITITGKKPARFDHNKHLALGVTCGQCHHDGEHTPLTEEAILAMDNGNELQWASCHNPEFANKKLNSVKLAFHGNCKGCHKQGVGDIKGPTKCTDCHIKKEK
jgi:hypothetical protein